MTADGRRAVRLEHCLTTPTASLEQLDRAVGLAVEYDLSAISVSPWLVKDAKRLLGRSRVTLATVVGFPHGGQVLAVKAFEASKALEHGAAQIDFVINAGALVSGQDEVVYNDMLAVVDMAHSALASCGVMVEVESLPDELVRKASRIAERAGADYVVTSAGNATARATVGRTALIRDSVGPRVQVKAAGRLRQAAELLDASRAGAARIATRLNPDLIRQVVDAGQPVGVAG